MTHHSTGDFTDKLSNAITQISGFEPTPTIAVACSGGADSMALLVGLHALATTSNTPLTGATIIALHVNHHLRDSAHHDWAIVQQVCDRLNIPCHLHHWNHGDTPPTTRIQEHARHARHALLSGWCHDHGVLHLCTAHHTDDQTETIALRQNAGSGTVGLSGMSACAYHDWGRVIRPLLSQTKHHCQQYLTAQNIPWANDPSNQNTQFERVRIRQTLTADQRHTLSKTAQTHAQHRAELDKSIAQIMPHCHIHPHGCVAVDGAILGGNTTPEVLAELFIRIIHAVGGGHYRVGANSVAPFLNNPKHAISIGGCDIAPHNTQLWITRSWGVIKPNQKSTTWDNRYTVPPAHQNTPIQPLTYRGWQQYAPTLTPEIKAQIRQTYPPSALYALPTTCQNGEITPLIPPLPPQYAQNGGLNWHRPIKICPAPFSYLI